MLSLRFCMFRSETFPPPLTSVQPGDLYCVFHKCIPQIYIHIYIYMLLRTRGFTCMDKGYQEAEEYQQANSADAAAVMNHGGCKRRASPKTPQAESLNE